MKNNLGKFARLSLLGAVALLAGMPAARAASTWSGPANGNWFDPNNWAPPGVPANAGDVLIGSGKTVVLTNETAQLGSLDLTGTLTFTNWFTTLYATNVTIQSAGIMKSTGFFRPGEMSNRVHVVCARDFEIKSGGKVDVTGNGYRGGETAHKVGYGPGGGTNSSVRGCGGGYGGRGGNGAQADGGGGTPYGTAAPPLFPGSGGSWGNGSSGTAGGGLVHIEAGGTVTVNGQILATGASVVAGDSPGCGSGGGIWITCGTLTGGTNGLIAARGSAPGYGHYGGPGGGGRIAILYATNDHFAGTCASLPGVRPWFSLAYRSPGTGTVYRAYTGSAALLTITGTPLRISAPAPRPYGSSAYPPNAWVTNQVSTPVILGATKYECAGWSVRSNATVIVSGTSTQAVFQMVHTNLNLVWAWTNYYTLSAGMSPSGTVSAVNGWHLSGTSVWISASPQTGYSFYQWMGDVPVGQETSNPLLVPMTQPRRIVAAFQKSTPTLWTWASGTGNWTNWNNWSPKGIPCGTTAQALISGGTVTLSDPMQVSSLTLTNAARVNFSNGLDAATLAVDGNLRLYGTSKLYVYAGDTNASRNWGALVTVGGLMSVANNCWVYPYSSPFSGGSPLFRVGNLALAGTAGGFDAGGAGYSGGIYPTAAQFPQSVPDKPGLRTGFGRGGGQGADLGGASVRGGGGGYGGKGGNSESNAKLGGPTNGVYMTPIHPGSGGAAANGVNGARGGGLIRIDAVGWATLNGTLKADGGPMPAGDSAGGGAGGGIWLSCRVLDGSSAVLTGKGGSAATRGGSGGGGRIALWYYRIAGNTNSWTVSVTNGPKPSLGFAGEMGTIYWNRLPPRSSVIMVQ